MEQTILPAATLAKLDALFPIDPLAAGRAVYEEAVEEHQQTFGPSREAHTSRAERPRREPGSHGRRKLTRRARMARGGR